MTNLHLELAKLAVSILALGGTLVAAVIAIRTYLRTEKWKRAEFLAGEMKEFLADRRVQNALLMIDWGTRRIRLLDEGTEDQGSVLVTRRLQIHALLPHTLINPRQGSDAEQSSESVDAEQSSDITESPIPRYTPAEAAIRDCYDALLDGLERFSSYVQTGLVDVAELRPYLEYWIDDIHAPTKDPDDAAWTAALLTYIDFYRFRGVQSLFRAFGRSIDPPESAFTGFLEQMEDQGLAESLAKAVEIKYRRASRPGAA
jgi:hypothetical protein